MSMEEARKQQLRQVFQDTLYFCTRPDTPDFKVSKPLIYDTSILSNLVKDIKPKYKKTEIKVVNNDTFDTAKDLLDSGITTSQNILVLNMASAFKPGGGVVNGASAQEECLFRRSNYFQHLPSYLYPLDSDAIIISRDVFVFKDKEYKLLPKVYSVNCVACSAVRKPKLKYDNKGYQTYSNDKNKEMMYQKIRDIFKVAYLRGYDTLVLGAIGCGAYGNPLFDVVFMFQDILKEFEGCFKNITFAVLSYGRNENYKVFKQHIEVAFDK
jgi:uncharacterized protein (TIGR02452 family)